MMSHNITQTLLFIILLACLLSSSQAHPVQVAQDSEHQSHSQGLSIYTVSSNSAPTTNTKPDSTPGNSGGGGGGDGSGASDTSSSSGGIGSQPLGVQLGGGFIIGCVIGGLGFAIYRALCGIIQARRRRRAGRMGSVVGGGRSDMQEVMVDV